MHLTFAFHAHTKTIMIVAKLCYHTARVLDNNLTAYQEIIRGNTICSILGLQPSYKMQASVLPNRHKESLRKLQGAVKDYPRAALKRLYEYGISSTS